MKIRALSIKNPWGELICEGFKSIETRTWNTSYRGQLLICISSKMMNGVMDSVDYMIDRDIAKSHCGYAIATCELVSCRKMQKEHEAEACCDYYDGYSWFLEDIRKIKPVRVKGRLGIYTVDVAIVFENWSSLVKG